MIRPVVIWLGILSLALRAALAGQATPVTHGFALGLHAQPGFVDSDAEPREVGLGAGLDMSYGFRNGVAILLTYSVIGVGPRGGRTPRNYNVAHLDAGIRYDPLQGASVFRPSIELAFSSLFESSPIVRFSNETPVNREGFGFTVGGGVSWFPRRKWAVAPLLLLTVGSFDETNGSAARLGGDVRTLRMQLGIRYQFADK
jgi:opacity protein-like surface antigen